jgi:hypothetical protein
MESALRPPLPIATRALADIQIQARLTNGSGQNIIASIRGSRRQAADIKSESRPASNRNRWPASYWNAWPASSESAPRIKQRLHQNCVRPQKAPISANATNCNQQNKRLWMSTSDFDKRSTPGKREARHNRRFRHVIEYKAHIRELRAEDSVTLYLHANGDVGCGGALPQVTSSPHRRMLDTPQDNIVLSSE